MKGAVGFVLLVTAVLSQAMECGYQSREGLQCRYDLGSLPRSGPPYYAGINNNHTIRYEVNICLPVDGEGCEPGSGVCQVYSDLSAYSLGSVFTQVFSDLPGGDPTTCPGVRLTYYNGSQCGNPGQENQVTIDIHCSSNGGSGPSFAPAVQSVVETSPCFYHINMTAAEACGQPMQTTLPSPSKSPSVGAHQTTSPTPSPTPGSASPPSACNAFPIQGLNPDLPVTLFGDTRYSPVSSDSCQESSPTNWYSLSTNSYSTITLTTCNSYTAFNTVLSVRGGSCTSYQCIAANDNDCDGYSSYDSTVSFDSEPGQTYFITVSGAQGAAGKYQLVVSATAAPVDPECLEAIPLPSPYYSPLRVQGSNMYANLTTIVACGLDVFDHVVWYHISPALGSALVLSTCSVNTDFDTVLAIFQGNCSDLRCYAWNDNDCTISGGNSQASTLRFTPTLTSYYVAVSGRSANKGYYQLYIQQQEAAGYDCESAQAVELISSGFLELAGSTDTKGNLSHSVCKSETGKAAWYKVSVAHQAKIQIQTCSPRTDFDTVLSVCSGTCNGLACVTQNDNYCENKSALSLETDAGDTFFVVVSGSYGAVGDFSLEFSVTSE